MITYTVFLGFTVQANDPESARDTARAMVDHDEDFPDKISMVGFEFTPDHEFELAAALEVLSESIKEVHDASN